MKRALILAAAAVVIVSNVWVLISARRNQSDASGGTVALTERELGLPPMAGDSTATFLELKWDTYSSVPADLRTPEWLGATKLAELGFDCHVPLGSPDARDYYSSQSPAPVFLVLEYEGEAWKAANRDQETTRDRGPKARLGSKTRLFAVDAGREAGRLRQKYPDRARWVIVRGMVKPLFQDRSRRDSTALTEPRLRGWLEVIPNQLFVPPPYSKVLQSLRRPSDQAGNQAGTGPRFAATVSWGARYEPWVQAVRLLPTTDAGAKTSQ